MAHLLRDVQEEVFEGIFSAVNHRWLAARSRLPMYWRLLVLLLHTSYEVATPQYYSHVATKRASEIMLGTVQDEHDLRMLGGGNVTKYLVFPRSFTRL